MSSLEVNWCWSVVGSKQFPNPAALNYPHSFQKFERVCQQCLGVPKVRSENSQQYTIISDQRYGGEYRFIINSLVQVEGLPIDN